MRIAVGTGMGVVYRRSIRQIFVPGEWHRNGRISSQARDGALLVLFLTSIVGAAAACGRSGGGGVSPTEPIGNTSCLERAVFGDPATSEYLLPYPIGASYSLMQTYCDGSHARDNQLAYDFLIPIGAEVVAARAGIVRRVVDTYADDDLVRSHNNHIFIEHADGTTAMYAHLVERSAVVWEGDSVVAGQLIALSGTSGTSIAHLHFGVYRTWPTQGGDDIPVNFRNAEGALDERGGLQLGVIYTALRY